MDMDPTEIYPNTAIFDRFDGKFVLVLPSSGSDPGTGTGTGTGPAQTVPD